MNIKFTPNLATNYSLCLDPLGFLVKNAAMSSLVSSNDMKMYISNLVHNVPL